MNIDDDQDRLETLRDERTDVLRQLAKYNDAIYNLRVAIDTAAKLEGMEWKDRRWRVPVK